MSFSDLGGLLGIFFGAISTFWFVLWYVNEKKKKRRENLKKIITRGISFLGKNYDEIYKFLREYHSEDFKKLKGKFYLVDYYYFGKIFGNKIRFLEKKLYEFPLVYKKTWLKSYNESFLLELKTLDDVCPKNELLNCSERFLKRFGIDDFIDFLTKECKKNVWSQITFDLCSIQEDNILTLFCCKSDYLNFVRSYELIQKELYYNYIYKNDSKFILRQAKNQRGESIVSKLEDYSWRPAKIGINVFTIMKRADGGYSTFIHKRKTDQVEYPEFYHVAPAGTFQPVSEHNIQKQYCFGYTIFREFLEELFNLEKADRKYNMLDPFMIFSLPVEHPQERSKYIFPGRILLGDDKTDLLYQKLNKLTTEKYEIIPTGFFIDITSFKPEITFILYIKDKDVHVLLQEYIRGCWEADISEYDLTGDKYSGNIFDFLSSHLNVNEFLPAGAIAISEGIKWYLENLV